MAKVVVIWGMEDGGFGDEGGDGDGGASTGSTVIVALDARTIGSRSRGWGGTTVVDGGGAGWEGEWSLCCMSIFMLNGTNLLKDLSDDSKVFLISRLVSMCSTSNLFSIVSSRLAC